MFPCGAEIGDGTYRTIFGPSVSHNSVIFSNTNHNFRLAMRRLTGIRAPEIPGLHDQLFINQANFINTHQSFLDNLQCSYEPYFEDYLGAELEAQLHHADPHEKKALRIQAWREMREEGINIDTESCWVNTVLWKLKTNEWAKPGKWPRSIGDLGVVASLLGFRLTNFLKEAQSKEGIEINGGNLVFCKTPDPIELRKHFKCLLDPPGRFYFLYFSDDACLSIRNRRGGIDRYNLDISSCDASHGPALFESLIRIMPPGLPREDMIRLVAQCSKPLRIVSRANKDHIVLLKPLRPMLYSGSTITTGINNLANLFIGLAISECDYTGELINGISEQILNAASGAGYMLTGLAPLEKFEDVQFLKNSPVLDSVGCWQPMLNFGVLLRASGTCRGDLPGHGPLRERGRIFQSSLLQGCYPRTHSSVLDAMRAACAPAEDILFEEITDLLRFKSVFNPLFDPFTVDPESFCARYRLDAEEYSSLFDFARTGFGECYNGSSVDKILAKDYDLHTTEFDSSIYLGVTYHTNSTEVVT